MLNQFCVPMRTLLGIELLRFPPLAQAIVQLLFVMYFPEIKCCSGFKCTKYSVRSTSSELYSLNTAAVACSSQSRHAVFFAYLRREDTFPQCTILELVCNTSGLAQANSGAHKPGGAWNGEALEPSPRGPRLEVDLTLPLKMTTNNTHRVSASKKEPQRRLAAACFGRLEISRPKQNGLQISMQGH